MSAEVVIEQMIMITLLIALGYYAYKKRILTDEGTRGISALIVTITNPCLMVYSMLSSEERISGRGLLIGLLSAVVVYVLLLMMAVFLPMLFRVKKDERYCYFMLCVFGNIGFIGIPLTNAVLGPDALVYVCFHNLIFCLLIYTLGIRIIRDAAGEKVGSGDSGMSFRRTVLNMINTGTVSAVAALIIYVAGWELPKVIMTTCDYAGRATTFLSMMVLGAAVARMSVKEAVSNVKLLGFSLIRLLIVPVVIVFILRLFISDPLTVNTAALMLAVPAGNMPLIMATQHRLDARTLSDGIILTTVMSVLTIPVVTLFC
ncbi:MAG: AEC family transporter [Lachnospiraceae bacterium]|nr:AEC family transporter [Lachnospiraceae bacterium]